MSVAQFTTDRAVLRRRNWAAYAGLHGAMAALLGLGALVGPMGLVAAASLALNALLFGNLFFWLNDDKDYRFRTKRTRGVLEVGPDGVSMNGRRIVARGSVTGGLVAWRIGSNPIVRIERGARSDIEIEVPSEEEGHALLRALGVDRTQRVTHFETPAKKLAGGYTLGAIGILISAYLILGVGFVARPWAPALPFGLLPLVMAAFIASAVFFKTRVAVGADGVTLKDRFAKERFIPYSDITSVEMESGQLRLALQSGADVPLYMPYLMSRRARERMAALGDAIREGKRASETGHNASAEARLAHRRGDVDGWIAELRTIGSGASADHRNAPIEKELLWRIALDPGAKPAARAGAAVALSDGLDDEARARLKDAAKATASPKTRTAIETAASASSDEALREALAELEQEDQDANEARRPALEAGARSADS